MRVGRSVRRPRRVAAMGSLLCGALLAGSIATSSAATAAAHSGRASAARASADAQWAQPDFDAGRSRFNPNEHMLSRSSLATLHPAWRIPAGDQCRASFGTFAYGMAYVGGCQDSTITAYDAATGRVRWSEFVPGQDWTSGPPTVANGRVFVVTEDVNMLDAVDAYTGRDLWSVMLDSEPSPQSPAVAGGLVIAGREAFDVATGKLRWRVPDGARGCGAAFQRDVTVTIAAGVVYLRCADGSLQARDLATGALRWTRPSSTDGTDPVVVGGVMYYGSAKRLVARDAVTGALRWQTAAAATPAQPAVSGGAVYAVVGSDRLAAFAIGTGKLLWTRSLGGSAPVPPAVANGVVYVRTSCHLIALNAATGMVVRRVASACSDVRVGGLAVVNGFVYANSQAFTI